MTDKTGGNMMEPPGQKTN